jgi:predicted DCC family thiol-disulfide oxidoreductase YuxK
MDDSPPKSLIRRQRPLFIFDGVCVLCSTGASFLMRHDPKGRVQFASAQSPLGSAIFSKLGKPIDESYLLIDSDGWHAKSDGYFQLARILGSWWRLALVLQVVPRPIRDWLYDRVAANRYRWFGKSEYCELLTEEQRERLVADDSELWDQLTVE